MNRLRGMTLYNFFSGHFSVSQGHKGMGHSTAMSTLKMGKMKYDNFTTNNLKFIVFGMFSRVVCVEHKKNEHVSSN